jgi:hypothetical protein
MAQTAAQKAAAAKAASKAAATKAKAAASKKKEDAYIASFSNPITSQYDPRIADNLPVKPENYGVAPINGPTWQQIADGADPETDLKNYNANKPKEIDKDALVFLNSTMTNLGIGSLGSVITQLLTDGLDSDSILTKLKFDTSINPKTNRAYNDDYTKRFSANEARKKAGLNVLGEDAYLKLENSYTSTLRSYGLGNMLSPSADENHKILSKWIANDLSADEFAGRIDEASTRVLNTDPKVLANFKAYYPEVNNTDLISYFLAPDETLPLLRQKITAAEIGASANMYGFNISGARAAEFAGLGETRLQAQADYAKIAEVLPSTNKLSKIYGEEGIDYGQAAAEDEMIKGDALAKLKRNRLASKERGSFQARSGVSGDTLSKSNLF